MAFHGILSKLTLTIAQTQNAPLQVEAERDQLRAKVSELQREQGLGEGLQGAMPKYLKQLI